MKTPVFLDGKLVRGTETPDAKYPVPENYRPGPCQYDPNSCETSFLRESAIRNKQTTPEAWERKRLNYQRNILKWPEAICE